MIENSSNFQASCPLCGLVAQSCYPGLTSTLKDGGRVFSYRRCEPCGLLFSEPLPTDEEMAFLYSERYDYEWFQRHKPLKRVQAWHRFRRLRSLWHKLTKPNAESPRYLDIGCGYGWMVEEAVGQGWKTEGLDYLNDDQVRSARERGLALSSCSLMAHPYELGSFDLTSMWHVLEHMRDPAAALKVASQLLKPGGFLVVAVPNYSSLGLRKTGERWGWLQKPFIHPFCFSANALKGFLPDSLQPVLITSRDTWDQQLMQDGLVVHWLGRINHFLFRGTRKVASMLRLRFVATLLDRCHFYAQELVLLISYAFYVVARRFGGVRKNYEQALKGAELMMVCKRVTPVGSVSSVA